MMTEPDKTLVDANSKYANSFFFIPISPQKFVEIIILYWTTFEKKFFHPCSPKLKSSLVKQIFAILWYISHKYTCVF